MRPRTRITVTLAGAGVLTTAVALLVFREEIEIRYHLSRLGSDPAYLKEILASPEKSPRWLAMRKFLDTYDGKQRLFEIVIEAYEELVLQVPTGSVFPLSGMAESDGVAVRWDHGGFEIKYTGRTPPPDKFGVPLETFLPDLVGRPYYPRYASAKFADFWFYLETAPLKQLPGFEPLGFPHNTIRLRADRY